MNESKVVQIPEQEIDYILKFSKHMIKEIASKLGKGYAFNVLEPLGEYTFNIIRKNVLETILYGVYNRNEVNAIMRNLETNVSASEQLKHLSEETARSMNELVNKLRKFLGLKG